MIPSCDKHKNIVRVDNDATRTHAWILTFARKKKIVVRYFSDSVYGGKEAALDAALAFRSFLLSCYSESDYLLWIRSRPRKNNTSGIPGVGRYEVLDNPNTGRRRAFWMASWTDENGRERKRKFSVLRHGDRRAKILAMAEREKQLLRVCQAVQCTGA